MKNVQYFAAALLVLGCGGSTQPTSTANEPANEPVPLAEPATHPVEPESGGNCTTDADCPPDQRCLEAVPVAAEGQPIPRRCMDAAGGEVAPAPAPEPAP